MDSKENKKQDVGNIERNIENTKVKEQESRKIPTVTFSHDEAWVKEYIEQFGEEPSFF